MAEGWVCPECGIDYGTLHGPDLAGQIGAAPAGYRELLVGADDASVRVRPEPGVWSVLEYTEHVADIFGAFAPMFEAMQRNDTIPDGLLWDQDERATERGYNEMPLDDVLGDLDANAKSLAGVLSNVRDDEWSNTAEFPWGERDLLTMAQNGVHESVHHLQDAERVLGQVRSAS